MFAKDEHRPSPYLCLYRERARLVATGSGLKVPIWVVSHMGIAICSAFSRRYPLCGLPLIPLRGALLNGDVVSTGIDCGLIRDTANRGRHAVPVGQVMGSVYLVCQTVIARVDAAVITVLGKV